MAKWFACEYGNIRDPSSSPAAGWLFFKCRRLDEEDPHVTVNFFISNYKRQLSVLGRVSLCRRPMFIPVLMQPSVAITLRLLPPSGHPTPRAVWDKDSLKLQEGGRYKMEAREETRTLEIPKVTQQDAGLYRVTIENDLGREQATARLDVISKCLSVK